MNNQFWKSIQSFENKNISTYFFAEQSIWLFSAIDTCNALIEIDQPQEYWSDLKRKLEEETKFQIQHIRILNNSQWENIDVLTKENIIFILSQLEIVPACKFESWLDEICNSIPEGCILSKSAREYEFLNLATNRFLDLYEEINGNNFMENSPEIRFYKIKEIFSVYSELLQYEPIKNHIKFLEKARPPMESLISNEFIKFIRNILAHFPFFEKWDDIYITKGLINWVSDGKTIDKFLNKYKGCKSVQYRFMEAKTRKWRYPTIVFPKDYGDEKIYIKNIINEKDGILLCVILMYRVVMSQIIGISNPITEETSKK